MNGTLEKAKSLHIFMFPFTWEYGGATPENKHLECIKTIIERNNWTKEQIKCFKKYSKLNIDEKRNDPQVWNYNQSQYFYENVNQAVEGDNVVVSNWKYKLEERENNYEIKVINKKDEFQYKSIYTLKIDSIRLKLYNSQIGILSFHLINETESNEEDILRINDYGRRIFPPFLPVEDSQNTVLAESITLYINKNERDNPTENFTMVDYQCMPFKISATIMCLLGNDFTSIPAEKKNKILVKPVIDDRMFVVCWWGNNERSKFMEKHHSMCDGDFWHKFFFVDNGYSGCQSQNMLNDLLKKHTYNRWLNYGTLFGITRYSLMLLTSDSSDIYYLRVHMWTIYYQMACLALAQRASILKFSQEISEIVGNENNIDSLQVQALHYEYLKFVNQLYFREVTAQEQGIEIYDMLVNSMAIERDVKRLDEEIGELYQHIRLEEDKKANETLYLLTVLGALFVFPNLLTSFFGMNISGGVGLHILFLVMFFIVPVVLALVFVCKKIKCNRNDLIYHVFRRFLIAYGVVGMLCLILWEIYGK